MWEIAGGIIIAWLAVSLLPPLFTALARGLPALLFAGGLGALIVSFLVGDSPEQRLAFVLGLVAALVGLATLPRDKKPEAYKPPRGWDKWKAYHRKPPKPWEKKAAP